VFIEALCKHLAELKGWLQQVSKLHKTTQISEYCRQIFNILHCMYKVENSVWKIWTFCSMSLLWRSQMFKKIVTFNQGCSNMIWAIFKHPIFRHWHVVWQCWWHVFEWVFSEFVLKLYSLFFQEHTTECPLSTMTCPNCEKSLVRSQVSEMFYLFILSWLLACQNSIVY